MYVDLFEDLVCVCPAAREKSCVLEHNLKVPKLELNQNTLDHESALSLVLPRGYHDLATRFC